MKNLSYLALFIFINLIEKSKIAQAFSECPVTSTSPTNADPMLFFISNCLSLVAYYQSKGQNIQQWCSIAANYQKCCITCQNYLKIEKCEDVAYESDCKHHALNGRCNILLSNGQLLSTYCQKSCNMCKRPSYLTCNQVNCNGGTCCPVSYFSMPSIQCTCPVGRGGAYCQLINPCVYSPCKNGGKCTAYYSEYRASYTCACPKECSGINCDYCSNACSTFSCLNGGSCLTNSYGQPVCACQKGYTGKNCEIFLGACQSNPCQNSGDCILTTNGFYCSCSNNFAGPFCEYEITYDLCDKGDFNETTCMEWNSYGFCSFTFLYNKRPVPLFCPVSCELCDEFLIEESIKASTTATMTSSTRTTSLIECKDKDINCPKWANMGLCDWLTANNPDVCQKACKKC